MPNSSSSKYVKRRRHRRTKYRRHAKKYTVKKVMRGCSSKQYGGAAPLGNTAVGGNNQEVPMGKASPAQAENLKGGATNVLALQQLAKASESSPYPPTDMQKGGYKSKHRRRHYKKSIGRKGRSRRFRG
jgi:hypothetical protein